MEFPLIRANCGSELQLTLVESAAMENVDKPAVRWMDISAEQAGQRIDNYLLPILKGVPKSRIYRLLRKGEVRVNKGRIRPEYRLQSGDQVRIPPVRVATTSAIEPGRQASAALADSILYEDDRLLVLNKPAGMAVHGGSGLGYGVIEALRALRPKAPYLELVHRLDRATSGCLMIAKRRSMLRELHAQLRDRTIDKRYLLLVQGVWRGGGRRVDLALSRDQVRGGERVVRVARDGQEAATRFTPLELFAETTLLRARPLSGRTHQIRVHATALGHPIAGDGKYGDPAFNLALRARGLRRLFLHACELRLTLPDGDPLRVVAPLAPELEAILDEHRAPAMV